MHGKCKWFNDKKGFGFITGSDGKDYFAHYSAIVGENRKTLKNEEEVEFEASENEKGLCALVIQRFNVASKEDVDKD